MVEHVLFERGQRGDVERDKASVSSARAFLSSLVYVMHLQHTQSTARAICVSKVFFFSGSSVDSFCSQGPRNHAQKRTRASGSG